MTEYHRSTFASVLACCAIGCGGPPAKSNGPSPVASASTPEPAPSSSASTILVAKPPLEPGYPALDAACAAKLPDIDFKKARLGRPVVSMPPVDGDDGTGFFAVTGALDPRTGDDAPIELRITAPATRGTKEKLSVKLTVANTSKSSVVVVRSMDGSTDHFRYPYFDLHVRDEATKAVYRWARVGFRCGNVNASTNEDHVKLAPGDQTSKLVDGWASHLENAVIPKPGKYTVWAVYGFCGYDSKAVPLGSNVVRKDTYVGVHASNGVVVTVK